MAVLALTLTLMPSVGTALSLAAVLLACAGATLLLKPLDSLAREFSLLLAVGAAALAAGVFSGSRSAGVLAVQAGALGLQPMLLLAFCQQYAVRRAPVGASPLAKWARFARGAAEAALLLAPLQLLALWLAPAAAPGVGITFLLAQLLGLGLDTALLTRQALLFGVARSRSPMLVVAAGSFVAYIPARLAALLLAVMGQQPAPGAWQDAALMLALPLSVGVASVRWRRASLVALIDRVSVYVFLALILLAIEVIAILGIERVLGQDISLVTTLLTLSLAALAAVTYAPLRARLRRELDALLFRDYYEFGPTLQRFSQELATLRDLDGVVNCLLDGLLATLNLTGIAFVALPEGLDQRLLRVIEAGDLRARRAYALPEGQAEILRGLESLDLSTRTLAWDSPLLLDPWPGCAALMLIGPASGGEGQALLVIGPKHAGGPLRGDDQALLVTLTHQAATALANALLVAGLRTSLAQVEVSTEQLVAARAEQRLLLRELVDADERQRAALARDLHDDALQEVLYLIRHSRLCTELVEALEFQQGYVTPSDADADVGAERGDGKVAPLARLHEELAQLAEQSVAAERKLRALYLGLYPALLPSLGLPAALDDLAKELASTMGIRIQVDCDDKVLATAGRLSTEHALHVYRVAQEALRNAGRHARASEAHIALHLASEPGDGSHRRASHRHLIELTVEDDGAGLPLPVDYAALLRQGHLGLAGMRERAERIGATLTFTHTPPQGTRVRLSVPLDVASGVETALMS
jgi:two-component sensor histidine kinase